MSIQHVAMVQNFLACMRSVEPTRVQLDMLAEDVTYDWFAAQDVPVKRSLRGRAEVEGYLSILPRTYQVLDVDEQTVCSTDEKVVAVGGERARIVRTGQIIHAEWIAVFTIESNRIKSIAMTIHRWTVLHSRNPFRYALSGTGPSATYDSARRMQSALHPHPVS